MMTADETEQTLKQIVQMLRDCAREHFFRYELNTIASDIEDVMEREQERRTPPYIARKT